jgi:hypothetical protein
MLTWVVLQAVEGQGASGDLVVVQPGRAVDGDCGHR